MFVLWSCLVDEASLGGPIVATSGSAKTLLLLDHIGNCLIRSAVAILKDCHSNFHNHSWHIKTTKGQNEGSHSIWVVALTHKGFVHYWTENGWFSEHMLQCYRDTLLTFLFPFSLFFSKWPFLCRSLTIYPPSISKCPRKRTWPWIQRPNLWGVGGSLAHSTPPHPRPRWPSYQLLVVSKLAS